MTEVRLIGGPLDGANRTVKAAPTLNFVWVEPTLRFYRERGVKDRLLYRLDHVRKVVKGQRVAYFIYAGHTHASCCDTYVKIDPAKPECPFCEAKLCAPQ